MNHPLPTIDETLGVGLVLFGMNPSQVRALLGEKLVWEAWMNGNVNDALYYPGIILFFDDHDAHGPTSRAKLEQIEVRPAFRALWRGIELSQLTPSLVAGLLGPNGQVNGRADGACEVVAPRLHAHFTSSKALA